MVYRINLRSYIALIVLLFALGGPNSLKSCFLLYGISAVYGLSTGGGEFKGFPFISAVYDHGISQKEDPAHSLRAAHIPSGAHVVLQSTTLYYRVIVCTTE